MINCQWYLVYLMKSRLVYTLSVLFLLLVAIATVSAGDRNAGVTVKGKVYKDIVTTERNYTAGDSVDFHVDFFENVPITVNVDFSNATNNAIDTTIESTTTTIDDAVIVEDSDSLGNNKEEKTQAGYEGADITVDCGFFCSIGTFFKGLLGM